MRQTWRNLFAQHADIPEQTLRWWLADRLHAPLTALPLNEIPPPALRAAFLEAVMRLRKGEPVQYVCGQAPFLDFEVRVDPRVLIPRPETEELVMGVLATHANQLGLRVLDVGTGSGCIAIALQRARPSWRVEGVDLSAAALEVARTNAAQLAPAVGFRLGDLLAEEGDASWDVIVSNPPYVGETERDRMDPWVLAHEPHTALFAGPDGLDVIRRLLKESIRVLAPGGSLHLESGDRQRQSIARMASELGWRARVRNDLRGKARLWHFQR